MEEQNTQPMAGNGPYANPAGYGGGAQYMGYSPAGADPLNTAKWAGLVQIILGSLIMAFGLCCLGPVVAMWDTMMMEPEFQQAMSQIPDSQIAKMAVIIAVVLSLGMGLLVVLLGVFMRRGSKVAAVCSVVVMSLVTLYFLVNLGGLVASLASNPALLPGLFVGVVLLLLSAGGLAMSIAGLRSIYQWHRSWAQWQAAYSEYQNQQQQP